MKQRRELDDQLNDCLERLANGEALEECVARYPARRDELVPLLHVAAATMNAASSVAYRPEAKARGLTRLTTELARHGVAGRRAGWTGWLLHLPKPILAGFAAVLMTSGLAVGTSMASTDSVPGDALYRVKSLKENISLMMPKSDMSKAEEHVRLASERTREIGMLVDRGMYDRAEEHESQIKSHLRQSAYLAGVNLAADPIEMPPPPLRPSVRAELSEMIARLHRDEAILRTRMAEYAQSLPPEQIQRVVVLMRRSEFNYRIYILVLESDGPPPLPSFMRTRPPQPRGR